MAANAIAAVLASLEDVKGVLGSFVVSDEGQPLGVLLPPVLDGSVLDEVGPRLARLRDTFSAAGDDIAACMLRYEDFNLCVRPVAGGLLVVLVQRGVNLPALKMALTLAARRLEPMIIAAPAGLRQARR